MAASKMHLVSSRSPLRDSRSQFLCRRKIAVPESGILLRIFELFDDVGKQLLGGLVLWFGLNER